MSLAPLPAARLGPRPLPLHLMSAAAIWMSSLAALPGARRGSIVWNPALAQAASRLVLDLAQNADPGAEGAIEKALLGEAQQRLMRMLDGILRYRAHPYRRHLPHMPAVWQEGSTEVLEYATSGSPVLLVPSLVNRGYVLDLSERRSLARYLAARGLRPWLIEWGDPGAAERQFTLDDYIDGRLTRIIDAMNGRTSLPVALIGYCMGGNLALAAAMLRPQTVHALALLATPWDFHAGLEHEGRLFLAMRRSLEQGLRAIGHLPVDALQTFFLALDPMLAARKFAAFSKLDPASAEAGDFVALEDWLNDGVTLAGPVAAQCLVGWYGDNSPARGNWRVAGRAVDPAGLRIPTLVAIPENDRIVPPPSAAALAAALPRAEVIAPRAGHIGMVVGSRAEAGLWQPLAGWLGRV